MYSNDAIVTKNDTKVYIALLGVDSAQETTYIRGAIQKFVDKCKEININHWIPLKIYEYKS